MKFHLHTLAFDGYLLLPFQCHALGNDWDYYEPSDLEDSFYSEYSPDSESDLDTTATSSEHSSISESEYNSSQQGGHVDNVPGEGEEEIGGEVKGAGEIMD